MPESDGVVATQSKKYKNERRSYIIRSVVSSGIEPESNL